MTIAFDFQYGMEIGDAPDDVSREVLDREERGDVEHHGQESRGEGRTSQAVEVRISFGYIFCTIVMYGCMQIVMIFFNG